MSDMIAFCIDADKEMVTLWIIMLTIAVIMLFIVPFSIYQAKHTDLSLLFKRFYYTNSMLFFIGCIGYVLHHGLPFRCITFFELNLTGWMGYGGYTTGLCTMYFLLLFRIHLIFKDTLIFYGMTLLVFIDWTIFMIGALFYSLSNDTTNAAAKRMGTVGNVFNIIIILLIATIFINKTHKLYQQLLLSINSTPKSTKISEEIKLKKVTTHAMIKYCICSSIALITTLLAGFMVIYRADIVEEDTLYLWYWHSTIGCVDALVNFICLALQFSFTENIYEILCGHCCEKLLDKKDKKVDSKIVTNSETTDNTTNTTDAVTSVEFEIELPKMTKDITKYDPNPSKTRLLNHIVMR
eukprot:479650_1